jgi:hypothetical protein
MADELTTDAFAPVSPKVVKKVVEQAPFPEPELNEIPLPKEESSETTIDTMAELFRPSDHGYLGLQDLSSDVVETIIRQNQEEELKKKEAQDIVNAPLEVPIVSPSLQEEPKLASKTPEIIKKVYSLLWKLEYGYVLASLPLMRQVVIEILDELMELYGPNE